MVQPQLMKAGQPLDLEWERGRLFDVGIAQLFQKVVLDGRQARVSLALQPGDMLARREAVPAICHLPGKVALQRRQAG